MSRFVAERALLIGIVVGLTSFSCARGETLQENDSDEAAGYSYEPGVAPSVRSVPAVSPSSAPGVPAMSDHERRAVAATLMKFSGRFLEHIGHQSKRGDGSLGGAITGPIVGSALVKAGRATVDVGLQNSEDEFGFIVQSPTSPILTGHTTRMLRIEVRQGDDGADWNVPETLLHSLRAEEIAEASDRGDSLAKRYMRSVVALVSRKLKVGSTVAVTLEAFLDDYSGGNGKRASKVRRLAPKMKVLVQAKKP